MNTKTTKIENCEHYNTFKIDISKKFDVVYVQCFDTHEYAFDSVRDDIYEYAGYAYRNNDTIVSSLHDFRDANFRCRDVFIINAIDNEFQTIRNLNDLNDFLENEYATKLCRCNQFECRATFYFVSSIPLECQNIETIKYVNCVFVENSSNSFDEYMIEQYLDYMNFVFDDDFDDDEYCLYMRKMITYMNEFLEYRKHRYNHISARYATK